MLIPAQDKVAQALYVLQGVWNGGGGGGMVATNHERIAGKKAESCHHKMHQTS
jgi:hypothetical protein